MRLHCVIFVEGQSEILCTYLPQEVTIGLLKAAMLTSPGTQGFLIDGFPRELQQGRMFTKQVPIVEYIIIVQLPNTILPKSMIVIAASLPKLTACTVAIVVHLDWEWDHYLDWEWDHVSSVLLL